MTKMWTKEDDQLLREKYNSKNGDELATYFGVTKKVIQHRVGKLGISRKFKLTPDKEQVIRENYGKISNKDLASLVGCKPSSMVHFVKLLEIPLIVSHWTKKEINFLLSNYGKLSYREIAEELGRTVPSIDVKLWKLGIKCKFKNKNTVPELIVGDSLKMLGIEYEPHPIIKYGSHWNQRFVPDFLLKSKVIIEVMGDFFHCNPVEFPNGPVCKIQKENLERDARKRKFYEDNNYTVLYLWESETCDKVALTAKLKDFVRSSCSSNGA